MEFSGNGIEASLEGWMAYTSVLEFGFGIALQVQHSKLAKHSEA
jgi:hypothetical protein